jgi:radical SAM protein (TIGR01212 family)
LNTSNISKLYTIGKYFKQKFGVRVHKVPISLSGFTCPNIDGSVTRGGCSFCENESFSPNLAKNKNRFKLNFDTKENILLEQQIEELKKQFRVTAHKLSKKFGAKKFIVYFQSFTNTYAPLGTLKALYEEALKLPDVVGLSIGTRTDSINISTLEYLNELGNDNEIWVEYGVQSIYDETLKSINRGHDYENVKKWILKTKEFENIKTCGHIIFGLPNETQQMMLDTTKEVVELGVDSIKFHPLYVVKHTLLANDYKAGKFTPIEESLYIDTLVEAIRLLPSNISIQRMSAGIDDDSLLAPSWCRDKKRQMETINSKLISK